MVHVAACRVFLARTRLQVILLIPGSCVLVSAVLAHLSKADTPRLVLVQLASKTNDVHDPDMLPNTGGEYVRVVVCW